MKLRDESDTLHTSTTTANSFDNQTAVVLIDFNKCYTNKQGTFHQFVNGVMKENDMLSNVLCVVQAARSNGALVVHYTSVDQHSSIACEQPLDDWNRKTADELIPLKSDIKLKATANMSSSLKCDVGLKSIIKKNGVQSVILLGFLSDLYIVDTALGLADEFPALEVFVCSDGCAAASQTKHFTAMTKTLPLMGVQVILCSDVMGVMMQKDHGPIPSLANEKFNVYTFQRLLRSVGVLISSYIVITKFNQIEQAKKHGPFLVAPIREIAQVLAMQTPPPRDHPRLALKKTFRDLPSVFNFTAGLTLLIGLFPIPDTINNITGGFLPSLCYLAAGAYSVIGAPINSYKELLQVEDNLKAFKNYIRGKARAYRSKKTMSGSRRQSLRRNPSLKFVGNDFIQQMTYIEEVIFSDNKQGTLSRADLEMLLLKSLGLKYTSQTLDRVLLAASKSSVLSPTDLHQFIESKDKARYTVVHIAKRVWTVVLAHSLSLGHQMSLCFFVAAFMSVVKWALVQASIVLGNQISVTITWLYLIGTIGFSRLAFYRVRSTYDDKKKAKKLLSQCLKYAVFYHYDDPILRNFNDNANLSPLDFRMVLESAGLMLSEAEINALVNEVDIDGDGTLTKSKLEEYLERKTNRQADILVNCMKNPSFVSNTSWFWGAVWYTVAFYNTGEVAYVGNIFGAVGYFIGGISYAYLVYETCIYNLQQATKLYAATEAIMCTEKPEHLSTLLSSTSLHSNGSRSISSLLTGSVLVRQGASRRLKVDLEELSDEGDQPDHFNFMTSLIGETDRCELTFFCKLGVSTKMTAFHSSIFMYRYNSDGNNDTVGFMVNPSCWDEESINANITEDGTKLQVHITEDEYDVEAGVTALKQVIEAKLPLGAGVDSASSVTVKTYSGVLFLVAN